MKTFRAFLRKEFLHIMRDRRTLLVLFGMPVVQIVLFGYAINTDAKDAKVAVRDLSHDVRSRSLTDALFASGHFVDAGMLHGPAAVEQAFRAGDAKLVVEIGPRFAQRLAEGRSQVALIADASDPNTANITVGYASSMIAQWAARHAAGNTPLAIHVDHRMHYNPAMKSVFLFVPGIITVILMLVSAMLTSISITREKESGSMGVMLVSPLRPGVIVLGKAVPYLLLSLVNAAFVLLVGRLLFHVPMEGSFLLLGLEVLLFILTALGIGLLISTVARTQQQALMLSLFVLMMPSILLSGFIFPVSSMPWPLRIVSELMPAKHFIIILRGILLKGNGIDVLWPPTLVLAGMCALLFVASVRKFDLRLQ